MAIDNNGRLTWTPATAHEGSHPITVTVTVTDAMAAVSQIFDVDVLLGVNSAPRITSSAPQSVLAGQAYLYAVQAADADGDPLQFSLQQAPPGMNIEPVSGVIQWPTTAADIGATHAVRVAVSSPQRLTTLGRLYGYDAAAEDPDGGALVWSLQQAPAGMMVDPASGRVRWQPQQHQLGDHQVLLRVVQGDGG